MKSYSDDIPNAQELKENTRYTKDTHQLIKTVGTNAMRYHEEDEANIAVVKKQVKLIGTLVIVNLVLSLITVGLIIQP